MIFQAAAATHSRHHALLPWALAAVYVFTYVIAAYWQGEVCRECTDTYTYVLWRRGEVSLQPGSISSELMTYGASPLPEAFAALASLGVPVDLLHRAFSSVCQIIGFLALFVFGSRLSRNVWAGLVAVILVPTSFVDQLGPGYGMSLGWGGAHFGALSGPLVFAIWALWILGCDKWRWWILGAALAGFLVIMHPTNGVIAFTPILALAIYLLAGSIIGLRGPAAEVDKHLPLVSPMRLLTLVVVFLASSAPMLVRLVRLVEMSAGDSLTEANWWFVMAFRKHFHVFFWGAATVVSLLTILGLVLLVRVWLVRRAAWNEAHGFTSVAFCAFALTGLGFVTVHIVPSPEVAGLNLSRALDPLLLILVAALAGIVTPELLKLASAKGLSRSSMAALGAVAMLWLPSVTSRLAFGVHYSWMDIASSLPWVALAYGGFLCCLVFYVLQSQEASDQFYSRMEGS